MDEKRVVIFPSIINYNSVVLSNSSYQKNLDLPHLLFIYYFIHIIQLTRGGGELNLMFFMQMRSCDTLLFMVARTKDLHFFFL